MSNQCTVIRVTRKEMRARRSHAKHAASFAAAGDAGQRLTVAWDYFRSAMAHAAPQDAAEGRDRAAAELMRIAGDIAARAGRRSHDAA